MPRLFLPRNLRMETPGQARWLRSAAGRAWQRTGAGRAWLGACDEARRGAMQQERLGREVRKRALAAQQQQQRLPSSWQPPRPAAAAAARGGSSSAASYWCAVPALPQAQRPNARAAID
jgi:hypothetical protein